MEPISPTIPVITTVSPLRALHSTLPAPISLVPTMGMLHGGHFELIRLAASQSASVIVSIYANPSQLLTSEDNESYLSNLDGDISALVELDHSLAAHPQPSGRIKAIFAPTHQAMYPNLPPQTLANGLGSYITIAPLSTKLENRPTYYRGVATIVLKLLNAVKPHKAFFGEKDAQQVAILKRMIEDFLLDVEIVVGPTIREKDGLTMGSRNVFLGSRRRKVACVLYRALKAAEDTYASGILEATKILDAAWEVVRDEEARQEALGPSRRARFGIEWLKVADGRELEEVQEVDPRIGGMVSGSVVLLPLEGGDDDDGGGGGGGGEDRGLNNGKDKIRMIDYVVLKAWAPRITNV